MGFPFQQQKQGWFIRRSLTNAVLLALPHFITMIGVNGILSRFG